MTNTLPVNVKSESIVESMFVLIGGFTGVVLVLDTERDMHPVARIANTRVVRVVRTDRVPELLMVKGSQRADLHRSPGRVVPGNDADHQDNYEQQENEPDRRVEKIDRHTAESLGEVSNHRVHTSGRADAKPHSA